MAKTNTKTKKATKIKGTKKAKTKGKKASVTMGPPATIDTKLAVSFLKKGMTQDIVSKKLGCSRSGLYVALKRIGYKGTSGHSHASH